MMTVYPSFPAGVKAPEPLGAVRLPALRRRSGRQESVPPTLIYQSVGATKNRLPPKWKERISSNEFIGPGFSKRHSVPPAAVFMIPDANAGASPRTLSWAAAGGMAIDPP